MKKTLIALTMLLSFGASAEIEMKSIDDEKNNSIKSEIFNELGGNDADRDITITNIVQLSNSDNFMFKVKEAGSTYSMLYIQEIKAIVIQGTGDIYDVSEPQRAPLNSLYEANITLPILKKINPDDIIEYKAENEEDVVFVFSDPDCGYCKKLHQNVKSYNEMGITLKYIPYPRGGTNGPGYSALVDAYCAEDRNVAFDAVKLNTFADVKRVGLTELENQACKNIVDKYYNLGNSIGVTGTPSIFDETGQKIGGYIPAEQMKATINRNKH